MNNINELTPNQIQELLELSKRLKEQNLHTESSEEQELPTEIFEELEYNTKVVLKSNLKRFARNTSKYNGGKWTQSGTVNRIYLPEIKKYQVDATQKISAFSKEADRLRKARCATAELYQEFEHVLNIGGTEDQMRSILERIKRLTVHQFGTSKELDKDDKYLTTKAIRLPTSLKYLEDDEDEDKDLFFS